MTPLEKLKILLRERASNYSDEYLSLLLEESTQEAKGYCRRDDIPDPLGSAVVNMALVKLNRAGAEGVASQGFSGVSESYLDGYPEEIRSVLRRYRKLVIL